MKLAAKGTLWMLGVYAMLLVVLGVWAHSELRRSAEGVLGATTDLVGREVASALRETALERLIDGDREAANRLRELIVSTAHRSRVVQTLSVIDAQGQIVVSERNDLLGRQLIPPAKLFADQEGPRLRSRFSGPFEPGEHTLFVPLTDGGAIQGYLQLELDNEPVARLYEGFYWRLLILALAGLAVIFLLGFILQIQLNRLQSSLTDLLSAVITGEVVEAEQPGDDFPGVRNAAHRLSRELAEARTTAELSRRELDTLSRVMDSGMLLLGAEGKPLLLNHAARDFISGGQADEFDQRWSALRPDLDSGIAELRNQQRPSTMLDVDLGPEGAQRPLRLEMYALDPQGWDGCLVIIKDRGLIKALETDLRAAARFRGLSTLYMGAAHELRSPLNSMVVNLERLKQTITEVAEHPSDAEALREKQLQYAETVGREVQRLSRYIQALLDMTSPRTDSRGSIELSDLLQEIVRFTRAQAKLQHVDMELDLPRDKTVVMGNVGQLNQAILNVVINALEVMPDGGSINVSLRAENEFALVRVCDTGPGIPESLVARIFDMHFTTKEIGTGVGLYVTRSVLHEHGGDVSVETRVGEGSCFHLQLPYDGGA